DGPKSWPRVGVRRTGVETDGTAGSDIRIDRPARRPVAPAKVSAIHTTDDRISFDVDRVGQPVLVKASYFPNWKASGAKGPFRVTPNQMVVIPTKHHVSLHYGYTPVDVLGWLLTFAGIAGLAWLALWGRVRYPAPPHEGEDPVSTPDGASYYGHLDRALAGVGTGSGPPLDAAMYFDDRRGTGQ